MDQNNLDAVSTILDALAASAGAGLGDGTRELAKDATLAGTSKLVALVRERLKSTKDRVGDAKLTVLLADPSPERSADLRQHLTAAHLDRDEEVMQLARHVLAAAGPAAFGPGSVSAVILAPSNKGGTQNIGGVHYPQVASQERPPELP